MLCNYTVYKPMFLHFKLAQVLHQKTNRISVSCWLITLIKPNSPSANPPFPAVSWTSVPNILPFSDIQELLYFWRLLLLDEPQWFFKNKLLNLFSEGMAAIQTRGSPEFFLCFVGSTNGSGSGWVCWSQRHLRSPAWFGKSADRKHSCTFLGLLVQYFSSNCSTQSGKMMRFSNPTQQF